MEFKGQNGEFLLFSTITKDTISIVTNDKILTKQQAIEDFSILYSSLINYHPNPFLYVAESDFKAYFETQKSNIPDNLSELEFHYLSRQLISQIKCGHTFAKPSKEWYASVFGKNVQLPFSVKYFENRLFISNTIDENFQFNINDELLSINNVKVADIWQQMLLMHRTNIHLPSCPFLANICVGQLPYLT